MQTEIEAKFQYSDFDALRKKLAELGGECAQPMRLMRRAMFDYPDGRFQNSPEEKPRLRVRDEGDKVTITFKKKSDTNYVYESETTVGSYDDMVKILEETGLVIFSIQESKRETWHFGDVEVMLDEWPWLKPYIEIEGPSEVAIQDAAKALGFDWQDAMYGSVDRMYRVQYPGMGKTESIGDVPEVRFDMPLPDYLRERQAK